MVTRDVQVVDPAGWVYLLLLDNGSSRLVQAATAEEAVQTLGDGLPDGTRVWAVPAIGVHPFMLTGAEDGPPVYPQAPCPTCRRGGTVDGASCRRCGGTGSVRQPGSHPINLPRLWLRQHRDVWPGSPA